MKSNKWPSFVLEAKFVDIVSLPFSILLCFKALPLYCTEKYNYLKFPLLQKEEANASEDIDAFSNAGVWSQLVFMWLNPLFKIGRLQKLELAHVPSVPLSETADKASSLLEETLPEASTLPKAIFRAIWRPLALNAVFAGVNTIASYIGPFLVKHLVKFLTEKGESDIYFLDDSFSAVDAHTGAHVFKKCLMRLLAEKTVIYVTHQLEFLHDSDIVLVVNDGRIAEWGKYDDLIADYKGELIRQMAAHHESLNQVISSQELSSCPGITSHKDQNQNQIKEDALTKGKLLGKITEEESETGRVKWHVYSVTITCAYKGALVPIMLLRHVLFQGLHIGSNYWIAWASEEEGRVSKGKMMWIFVLLSGGSSFFILGRAILLSTLAIETGQRLFHKTNTSVFRAPISFFDPTPSSRILSRSSIDQSTVGTDLPYRVAGLAFALIQLFSIIILLSQAVWQVFPLFLGILAISIWYHVNATPFWISSTLDIIKDYYITTARKLARMVGIRKAPILHHFSESVTGAATIRCFNQEDRLIRKNSSLIDGYSRIAFHNSATMEWLSVRVNTLFNFVLFVVLSLGWAANISY